MQRLNTVIGRHIKIESDMHMEPIRGKILNHKKINIRFSLLTVLDEYDTRWELRVPNRALEFRNHRYTHRSETYFIY